MDGFVLVSVKFFSNSYRKTPPCLKLDIERYSPHFLVKGDEEYLGVTFWDGDVCIFNKEIYAIAGFIYQGVGYYKLVKNVEFFIMEGPHMVGEGVVEEVCKG